MEGLPALSMSHTKDELLKHLNLDQETYTKMAMRLQICNRAVEWPSYGGKGPGEAHYMLTGLNKQKETDRIYQWLTAEKRHLKKNCKRKPPYDWSDILERSKDEAMERIARSSDARTSYYWNLASPSDECPNWIARWFLYHKFRYRDGRNRNITKVDDGKRSGHHQSSKQQPRRHQDEEQIVYPDSAGYHNTPYSYNQSESMASGSEYGANGYGIDGRNSSNADASTSASASASSAYGNDESTNPSEFYADTDESGPGLYYDPVRDARMPNS